MARKRGLTLVELLLTVAVIAVLAWLLIAALGRRRAEARLARCATNLDTIAKALVTYEGELGDNRWLQYPVGQGRKPGDFNGAEWLAALYWNGVLPPPWRFLCPNTRDTNSDGRDLGTRAAPPTFGSQTVSYAALHYRSITNRSGVPTTIPADPTDHLPATEPVACDDTQGTVNHGEASCRGMNVLFFDDHVEWKPYPEVDPATAVGATAPPSQPLPLLWRLRN